jgi:hypothetical protein
MTNHTAALNHALRDLPAWTGHFLRSEIPVLAQTAESLEAMRANEDAVDANAIGEMTVTATLVMMGISPFVRAFGPQECIDSRLATMPEALDGLNAVLKRAYRGANFALAFAVHRMDPDAAVIHEAALLHDFAEMLLWCHAPALALRIRAAQRADPGLRSSAVQREVLNIELADLQQALMKAWRLPELLIRISDERHAERPSVRNVLLAVRLARHSALGWGNAALPDDIAEIAALLNLSPAAALQMVRSIEA